MCARGEESWCTETHRSCCTLPALLPWLWLHRLLLSMGLSFVPGSVAVFYFETLPSILGGAMCDMTCFLLTATNLAPLSDAASWLLASSPFPPIRAHSRLCFSSHGSSGVLCVRPHVPLASFFTHSEQQQYQIVCFACGYVCRLSWGPLRTESQCTRVCGCCRRISCLVSLCQHSSPPWV